MLATEPVKEQENPQHQVHHHKKSHPATLPHHVGQVTAENDKQDKNHGPLPAAHAPHHSKSQRHGRRHKAHKNERTEKSEKIAKKLHTHQARTQNHKKSHKHNKSHGRKHH